MRTILAVDLFGREVLRPIQNDQKLLSIRTKCFNSRFFQCADTLSQTPENRVSLPADPECCESCYPLGMRFSHRQCWHYCALPRLHGFLIRQKGGRLHEKTAKAPSQHPGSDRSCFCPSEVQANHPAPLRHCINPENDKRFVMITCKKISRTFKHFLAPCTDTPALGMPNFQIYSDNTCSYSN